MVGDPPDSDDATLLAEEDSDGWQPKATPRKGLLSEGDVVGETYVVERLLGVGGMGEVWSATHRRLAGKRVAIKVLRSGRGDDTLLARFRHEAEAAARIGHPNIVEVIDFNMLPTGEPYMVMEYLVGEPLGDRIERGPMPLADVQDITYQIGAALHAAHAHGVVHRDMKPDNVFLSDRVVAGERRTHVTVLDFGISKVHDSQTVQTNDQVVLGTPCYMAPEQATRNAGIDARTDLFAVGVMTYEMLSGHKPFDGDSLMSILFQVVNEEPKPLGERVSALSKPVIAAVERAMSKDQAVRFNDMAAFVQAFCGRSIDTNEPAYQETMQAGGAEPLPTSRSGNQTVVTGGGKAGWIAGLVALILVGAGAAFFLTNASQDGASEIQSAKTSPEAVDPGAAVGAEAAAGAAAVAPEPAGEPIRVGVLHSLSGTMRDSEQVVVDAIKFAIDELNAAGGVLGRPVTPVVADGRSDWGHFAKEAERLITKEKVSTIFGCWTSASRKKVKPVIEAHDHLLIYPVQYEGLEMSPNIIYLGAAPNQQLIPAVKWAFTELEGRRYYLVGSDYIFPRAANAIITDTIRRMGAEVVGESYVPLGDTHVDAVVADILATKPDVILNTINGDTNSAFFRVLREAGVTPKTIPTVSFSFAEQGLLNMGADNMTGDYAAWTYFQSVSSPENTRFVEAFRKRFGAYRVVTDPMEAAYAGVHLWAQAVEAAGSDDVKAINAAILDQRYEGPGGPVHIDPATRHATKYTRIGRIQADGQFKVVDTSAEPLEPVPFPKARQRAEWEAFLTRHYEGWGNQWGKVKGGPDIPTMFSQRKAAESPAPAPK